MWEEEIIEKGCILFMFCGIDLPGRAFLFILAQTPAHYNPDEYLFIYIQDLFCSEESCLGWPRSDWTIWLSSGRFWRTGESPEPQHARKTGPGIFLWSIIHVAGAEIVHTRQRSEL